MKITHKPSLVLLSLVSSTGLATAQVIVSPSTGNLSPVQSATFDDNGTAVTLASSQPNSTNNRRSTDINLTQVNLVNGQTLNNFNIGGAQVTLDGFNTTQPSGIGVLASDGTQTNLSAGGAAFAAATEDTLQNTNINSYLFYDNVSSTIPPNITDFSINYRFGFEASDQLYVQERNGNTFFSLTALDIDGNVIQGANVLQFGDTGGSNFSEFDFNTGFANDTLQPNQEYVFTVAEISEFFNGTGLAAVPIFGFAIDNDGDADVKFFGISDDTFLDNPIDERIAGATAVPEPGTTVLALLASLAFLRRRR